MKTSQVFKALTIAGSDSGGGAGIQADLKTFQELGVFGMSAITAITAQNTLGVQAVYPMSAEAVAAQIRSIGEDIGTDAVKTGMLFSADIIQAVAEQIRHYRWNQVVIDPVMIAKGGASLLQQEAITALLTHLLPLATIITPNIPEAEELTGLTIHSTEDKKEAARILSGYGAKVVIIKGGHDAHPEESVDLLYDGKAFHTFVGNRIPTKNTHGTGCTFSSAIAAELAKGTDVIDAVRIAKQYIQAAIEHQLEIGHGHGPTNHWAYRSQAMAANRDQGGVPIV